MSNLIFSNQIKLTIDLISFDPRLITENNLIDDKRPHRYEQNTQVYLLSMRTTMKMITIMKKTLLEIKMTTAMKILYII